MSEISVETFAIAVKAFIVHDDKILIMKRSADRPHNAGNWEFPGGRLELGEDPEAGLIREVDQETGLSINVVMPFEVHSFVRDDRQFIVMITFLCKVDTDMVRLSSEHEEFEWVGVDEVAERTRWEEPVVEAYKKLRKYKFV